VLSGDRAAGAAHGLNVSAAIVDELHAHKNPELYYALRTAMRAREQPLLVSITTAGFDLETICGELYLKGVEGRDPRFFMKWFEVPEKRLRDKKAWLLANPASWITLEGLEQDAASLPPSVFERLHLNRWTETVEAWLPPGAWDACRVKDARPEEGERIWVGVDLGLRHDTAAIAWVAIRDDGTVVCDSFVWGVKRPGQKADPPAHEIVAGDEFQVKLAREFVRELGQDFDVEEVSYDPYRFTDSAQLLADEGFVMVEFPQSDTRMVPASSSLFERIVERRLHHDGDPVLAKHLANAVARETGSGQRLSKKDGKKPQDAAIALALALERAEASEFEVAPEFIVLG
jgi:phage terminase large subunit-like protein